MKKTIRILGLMLVLSLAITCLFACASECDKNGHVYDKNGVCTVCGKDKCELTGTHTWHNGVCVYDEATADDFVDYVSELKLNTNSGRNWTTATVKNYVDGDTTHFNVPTSVDPTGVLKARYLAVNTPESTGQVEPYGKVASNFTKSKLSSASEIILESGDGNWNKDSTSTRYTVWIWYRTSSTSDYRNLNLELLQEGLGIASNAEGNCYGEICGNAIRQAQRLKYRVHDDDVPDDTFYYGDAIPVTLKELRCNVEEYNGLKVAFDGIVVLDNNNGVYVEDYDENDEICYGMYAYYGFTKNGALRDILMVGHHVRIVGNVSEFNGTYQVSGLSYRELYPDDPNNTTYVPGDEEKHFDPRWTELTVEEFYNEKTVTILGKDDVEDQDVTKDLAALTQATSVYMKNLVVKSVYTTTALSSSSRGAISITCTQEGSTKEIVIRTGVLKDPTGAFNVPLQYIAPAPSSSSDLPEGVVLADYFVGKTFNVKGVIGYYNSDSNEQYGTSPYQINVFSLSQIEFVD
ncbi:MAG: thermonuclease family protein [Corallococcus sp.]|nr:thermonuclease family protein [Corallococcus sp.]MCM1359619.1 thermonuclease family protein [Corallococcus sp.]MCM1395211.1 thermonuclease family protein [Corallococcus sp.]